MSVTSTSYNNQMDFSTLGPWIAAAAAVSALMRPLAMWIALRGTKPRERPEILRAMNARGDDPPQPGDEPMPPATGT
jgi:hypothetical protein